MPHCSWHRNRMGAFLDKPEIKREHHSLKAGVIEAGLCSIQGWRVGQEVSSRSQAVALSRSPLCMSWVSLRNKTQSFSSISKNCVVVSGNGGKWTCGPQTVDGFCRYSPCVHHTHFVCSIGCAPRRASGFCGIPELLIRQIWPDQILFRLPPHELLTVSCDWAAKAD